MKDDSTKSNKDHDNTSTSKSSIDQIRVGIQGVHLKKYEQVVCDCLNGGVIPNYFPLPNLPNQERMDLIQKGLQYYNHCNSIDSCTNLPLIPWPFNILHPAVCVRHVNLNNNNNNNKNDCNSKVTGKLSGMRAIRKEWQLCSMIQCLLAMIPSQALGAIENVNSIDKERRINIVDFAGGTGHLALPLALLLPKCNIILVDLKATSLELVHEKAKELTSSPIDYSVDSTKSSDNHGDTETIHFDNNTKKRKKTTKRNKPAGASKDIDVTSHSNTIRQCTYIKNLYTYHGSISTYAKEHHFDIGLSLHCCGEGTDLVLRACGEAKANFVVSPCCVGKLSSQKQNPYVYHATSSNDETVSYPQSSTFCKLISNRDKFDSLAKAADYSSMDDMRTKKNATRRTAKALLESDRLLFMKEKYGYDDVVLTRMSPWEASPKNDILIGWFDGNEKSFIGPYTNNAVGFESVLPCEDCNADVLLAVSQLTTTGSTSQKVPASTTNVSSEEVNWSKEEIDEFTTILQLFMETDLSSKRFPTSLGPRKRKLVHFLAEKMNLIHWSEGKKNADKIVVVAKRRQNITK